MVLDTSKRRRLLLDLVWENAVYRATPDDAQGIPPDALECWENFNKILDDLGVEIVLQPIEGTESVEDRVGNLRSITET